MIKGDNCGAVSLIHDAGLFHSPTLPSPVTSVRGIHTGSEVKVLDRETAILFVRDRRDGRPVVVHMGGILHCETGGISDNIISGIQISE